MTLAQREEIALGRARSQSVSSAIRHWAGVTPLHRWLGAEASGLQAIRSFLRRVAFRA